MSPALAGLGHNLHASENNLARAEAEIAPESSRQIKTETIFSPTPPETGVLWAVASVKHAVLQMLTELRFFSPLVNGVDFGCSFSWIFCTRKSLKDFLIQKCHIHFLSKVKFNYYANFILGQRKLKIEEDWPF